MINTIEVALDIDVDYPISFAVAGFSDSVKRSFCTSFRTKSEGYFLEICFEDGFNHEFGCHLYDSVAHGGYAQRSWLPVFLWDIVPPYGLRMVVAFFQFSLAVLEEARFSLFPNICERHGIYSCSSLIRFHPFPGFAQHIRAVDFVVQGMEFTLIVLLGRMT
ncbi:hypothetical protein D3C72_1657150 [compost metagenome]